MTDQGTVPAGPDRAHVTPVRFEHHRHGETLGIGEPRPRLSWQVRTDLPDWTQLAYELRITDPAGADARASGRVASAESVLVPWAAPPLGSRDRRDVRVRVWGTGYEGPSAWSEPARVEAGLLRPADWTASVVAAEPPDGRDHDQDPPAALLRREFTLTGHPVSARLYVTALGVHESELNGARVGDDVLAPGWTSYEHRLRYRTFDVTHLLRPGRNVLGAWLADGWYAGRLGWTGRRHIYGERPGLLAQLEITHADGGTEIVGTDGHWRSAAGPITATGLYDGETYDARLEQPGWSAPGFDDGAWRPVDTLAFDPARLVAPTGPPVRRTEEIAPVGIGTSPSGRTIVDFGQNLTGRVRLTVTGPAGRRVTLRHAEVLEGGELAVRPLRGAKATDTYVLRGDGAPETWEPRFTFHGFRYAEVDGWPGEPTAADLRAVVCHTDLDRAGWFSCSDPLVNRLHDNVVWSMRGNFLDVPTDCPQRDERLGWTGDLQVFAPVAAYLYDCTGMLTSWLRDLAVEQGERDGFVPLVVPDVFHTVPMGAWGDAATVVPSVLHERTGDRGLLRDQYPSMAAWVRAMAHFRLHRGEERYGPVFGAERGGAAGSYIWDDGIQLGDWLDPSAPPDRPGATRTDRTLVAAAYLVRSAQLTADAAALLELADDVAEFSMLAEAVKAEFQDTFGTPAGRLAGDSQTSYALALRFGLLPDERTRRGAARRLAELVRENGHAIGTGFVGTPLICDALCDAGVPDSAYAMLLHRACPSFLYPVTMGATTIWERWDSLLPDGTVNPGEMTSFNHYALGAVADWLHRTVAGLAPAAPGYREILVRPIPGGGLTSAMATHETPYGRAEVTWQRTGTTLSVGVTVPPGTTALVDLGGGTEPVRVGSGRHTFGAPCRAAAQDPPAEPTLREQVFPALLAGMPRPAGGPG